MNLAKRINQREWYFYYFKNNFYYYKDNEWHTLDFIGLEDARKHGASNVKKWPPINHKEVKLARLSLRPGAAHSYTIEILDNKEE